MEELLAKVLPYTPLVGAVGLLGAAVGFFFDRWRERKVRKDELAWRKTEFLADLGQRFDNDPTTREALALIDGPEEVLHRLCETPTTQLPAEDLRRVHALDRYLDFFDRMYVYVFTTQTLTLDEAAVFSGYLDVLDRPVVWDYADARGFGDSLRLHREYADWVEKWNAAHA